MKSPAGFSESVEVMSLSPLIVLVNLNSYLGGGETLMVRFAEYLQRECSDFLCVCASGSYIYSDLRRKGIPEDLILHINSSPDYYYANRANRQNLVKIIASRIHNRPARLISFCMRDLYTVYAISWMLPRVAIVHLILHIQDDLYVGQTVAQRIAYHLTGHRRFGNSKIIKFNRELLSLVNENDGLICMADVIAQAWRRNFGIIIPPKRVIPLPSFVPQSDGGELVEPNNKIIWIGRLVDFKIPALLAMIDFLGDVREYKLTIIGGGNRSAIIARMKDRGVSEDRVDFLGEVPYSDLGKVIRGHSIGYAMGTSLIELAKFRIPVIVALASYAHTIYRRPICGGLFYDQPRGCDGSELAVSSEDEIGTVIEDAIRKIEADWKGMADACYAYARDNYSVEDNFSSYRTIIDGSNWIPNVNKVGCIPTAPLGRRMLNSLKRLWLR